MSDKNNTFIILRVTKDFKKQLDEYKKYNDVNLSKLIREFLIKEFDIKGNSDE
jgi:hypothetical protein